MEWKAVWLPRSNERIPASTPAWQIVMIYGSIVFCHHTIAGLQSGCAIAAYHRYTQALWIDEFGYTVYIWVADCKIYRAHVKPSSWLAIDREHPCQHEGLLSPCSRKSVRKICIAHIQSLRRRFSEAWLVNLIVDWWLVSKRSALATTTYSWMNSESGHAVQS